MQFRNHLQGEFDNQHPNRNQHQAPTFGQFKMSLKDSLKPNNKENQIQKPKQSKLKDEKKPKRQPFTHILMDNKNFQNEGDVKRELFKRYKQEELTQVNFRQFMQRNSAIQAEISNTDLMVFGDVPINHQENLQSDHQDENYRVSYVQCKKLEKSVDTHITIHTTNYHTFQEVDVTSNESCFGVYCDQAIHPDFEQAIQEDVQRIVEEDDHHPCNFDDAHYMDEPSDYINTTTQFEYQKIMKIQPGPHEQKRKSIIPKNEFTNNMTGSKPHLCDPKFKIQDLHVKRLSYHNVPQNSGETQLKKQRLDGDLKILQNSYLSLISDSQQVMKVPLYHDADVGINFCLINEYVVESDLDNDCASDDDSLHYVACICYNEVEKCLNECSHTPSEMIPVFLRNADIASRCAHPEVYNRQGKRKNDEKLPVQCREYELFNEVFDDQKSVSNCDDHDHDLLKEDSICNS